ncbi:hypothetical protein P9112_009168 [Eukaryota sp. TZLM1-RC]
MYFNVLLCLLLILAVTKSATPSVDIFSNTVDIDSPEISEPTPSSKITWEREIQIRGKGFLESELDVQFGHARCGSVEYVDSTLIKCHDLADIPSSSFTLRVTFAETSLSVPSLMFESPIITRIVSSAPESNFPCFGNVTIVIYGANFDQSSQVIWDSSPVDSVEFKSTTELHILLPPGFGRTSFYVLNQGSIRSPATEIVYDIPIIHKIESMDGFPVNGNVSVSIIGDNFPLFNETDIKVVINSNQECEDPFVSAESTISCILPPGSGGGNTIKVIVNGEFKSSPANILDYNKPTIDRVEGSFATKGGDFISIVGEDFGLEGSNAIVKIGSQSCTNVSIISSSNITCTLPPNAGTGLRVSVTVDGIDTSSFVTIDMDPPIVESFSPQYLSLNSELVLKGRNFWTDDDVIRLSFDPFMRCQDLIVSIPHEEIKCSKFESVDPHLFSQDPKVNVVLSIMNQDSDPVTIPIAPSIVSLSSTSLPTKGGAVIEAEGVNLEVPELQVKMRLDDVMDVNQSILIDDVDIHSSTLMSFYLPSGYGRLTVLLMIDDEIVSSFPGSYDVPVLTSVDSDEFPTVGGSTIKVIGENFYGPEASGEVIVDGEALNATILSDSELEFQLPPGQGISELKVKIGSLVSTSKIFKYSTPELSLLLIDDFSKHFIHSNYSYETSELKIEFSGKNFGRFSDEIFVYIENQNGLQFECANIELVQRHAELSCAISYTESVGELNGPLSIVVNVSGLSSSEYGFNLSPIIYNTSAIKNDGLIKTDGSSSMFIHGVNLKYLSNGDVLAKFSHADTITLSNFDSSSKVEVKVPKGQGTFFVSLEGNQFMTNSLNSAYSSPGITKISASQGFSTRGDSLVLLFVENLGGKREEIKLYVEGQDQSIEKIDFQDSFVSFFLSEGAGNLAIVLEVSGLQSSSYLLNYDPPEIFNVSAGDDKWPTVGNFEIEINGSNFGPKTSNVTILVGQDECQITSHEHTFLSCLMPSFQGVNNLTVTVEGQQSKPQSIKSDGPSVSNIDNGDMIALEDPFILSGNNFGSNSNEIVLEFGKVQCPIIEVNHQKLNCIGLADKISSESSQNFSNTFDLSLEVSGQSHVINDLTFEPSIISIKPLNSQSIKTQGGQLLEVSGLNWLPDETPSLKFGPNSEKLEVIELTRTSANKATFTLPPGSGNVEVYLVFNSIETGPFHFAYTEPKIESLEFENGLIPATGGVNVVLHGSNFGSKDQVLKIQYVFDLFDTEYVLYADAINSSSAHTVRQFQLFPGFSKVFLTPIVDNINGSEFSFHFDRPLLTSLDYDSIPTTGGEVSLEFVNFPPNSSPFTQVELDLNVSINNQSVSYDYSRNSDIFDLYLTIPAGVGELLIDINSALFSIDSIILSYDNPAIFEVLPNPVHFSKPIVIQGQNFGSDPSLISLSFSQKFNCSNLSITIDHFELTCFEWTATKNSFIQDQLLLLSVGGSSTNVSIEVSRSILSWVVSPPTAVSDSNITFYGAGLDDVSKVKMTFDDVDYDPIYVGSDQIVFKLPHFNGTRQVDFSLLLDGEEVLNEIFVYNDPSIVKLSGHLLPDENFTIVGENLGNLADFELNINDNDVSDCSVVSYSRIVCQMPSISCELPNLMVLKTDSFTLNHTFDASAPYIKPLNDHPLLEGSTIGIEGAFGPEEWERSVYIDEEEVDFTFLNHKTLEIKFPQGHGQRNLTVELCGSLSSTIRFSYVPPSIQAFESGPPSTVGGFKTILGNGFTSTIHVSTEAKFISNSRIQVYIPPGAGKNHSLQIRASGLSSNEFYYDYQPPIIDKTSSLKKTGGKLVINGHNFGPSGEFIDEVLVGSKKCTGIKLEKPHEKISCKAPPITPHSSEESVVVSIAGQTATGLILFSEQEDQLNWFFWGLILVVFVLVLVIVFIRPIRQGVVNRIRSLFGRFKRRRPSPVGVDIEEAA